MIKTHALLARRRVPPPGRADHRRSRLGGPRLASVNPNLEVLYKESERVPRDERHPPRVVADVGMRARGAKSGRRELRNHLVFAVALQADARAQLPVVR